MSNGCSTPSALVQNGAPFDVVPFALGDLDDGDNNHLLCLNVDGTPVSISFDAGLCRRSQRRPESGDAGGGAAFALNSVIEK